MAGATFKYVLRYKPDEISFVITGGLENDEDVACADYLEKKFTGQPINEDLFIKRVYDSRDALQHMEKHPQFPYTDLDYCSRINYFDFAMPIERTDGFLIMQAIKP